MPATGTRPAETGDNMSSVATNGQATGLEHLGVEGAAAVYRNLNEAALYQEAVKRGEHIAAIRPTRPNALVLR